MLGYCPYHKQTVQGSRYAEFHWCIFIILFIIGWFLFLLPFVVAIIYLIWFFATKKEDKCPYCGTPLIPVSITAQAPMPSNSPQMTYVQSQPQIPSSKQIYCPWCGKMNDSTTKFCMNCGKEIPQEMKPQ